MLNGDTVINNVTLDYNDSFGKPIFYVYLPILSVPTALPDLVVEQISNAVSPTTQYAHQRNLLESAEERGFL